MIATMSHSMNHDDDVVLPNTLNNDDADEGNNALNNGNHQSERVLPHYHVDGNDSDVNNRTPQVRSNLDDIKHTVREARDANAARLIGQEIQQHSGYCASHTHHHSKTHGGGGGSGVGTITSSDKLLSTTSRTMSVLYGRQNSRTHIHNIHNNTYQNSSSHLYQRTLSTSTHKQPSDEIITQTTLPSITSSSAAAAVPIKDGVIHDDGDGSGLTASDDATNHVNTTRDAENDEGNKQHETHVNNTSNISVHIDTNHNATRSTFSGRDTSSNTPLLPLTANSIIQPPSQPYRSTSSLSSKSQTAAAASSLAPLDPHTHGQSGGKPLTTTSNPSTLAESQQKRWISAAKKSKEQQELTNSLSKEKQILIQSRNGRMTTELTRVVKNWKPFDPTQAANQYHTSNMKRLSNSLNGEKNTKQSGDETKTVSSDTTKNPNTLSRQFSKTLVSRTSSRTNVHDRHPHQRGSTCLSHLQHQLHRIQSYPTSQRIHTTMNQPIYLCINIILTLLSLFLKDISIVWIPKTGDLAISIILCTIFILFVCEISISCVTRRGYINSYIFWLDLVGTLSLILDIDFILNLDDYNVNSTLDSGSSRVTQSVSIVRVTKFARLLRVLRLVRVIRIFKFTVQYYSVTRRSGDSGSSDMNGHSDAATRMSQGQSNKVGLTLSESIDKHLIFMMLTLLIAMPLLTTDSPTLNTTSAVLGIDMIESQYYDSTANAYEPLDPTTKQMVIQQYIDYHSDTLIYLFIAGSTSPAVDLLASYQWLRSNEKLTFESSAGTISILNARDIQYQSAGWDMALTLFVIILFLSGSVIITRDIHRLVVAPLERMTRVIQKLTGTLCFLQNGMVTGGSEGTAGGRSGTQGSDDHDSHHEGDGVQGKKNQSAYETQVIENMISQLAHIFSVEPGDISSNVGQSKAMQMMAGSKHTEIHTNNSVVSIEVVERPKEPSVHLEVVDDPMYEYKPINLEVYKELSTMDNILNNPSVLAHFKLYMKQNLLYENLAFWSEVARFRSIMRLHVLRLYHAFISAKSSTPINIPSTQRESVRVALEDPPMNIFDQTQAECLQLMKGSYQNFLASKFCQMYLRKRSKTAAAKQQANNAAAGNKQPTLFTGINALHRPSLGAEQLSKEKQLTVTRTLTQIKSTTPISKHQTGGASSPLRGSYEGNIGHVKHGRTRSHIPSVNQFMHANANTSSSAISTHMNTNMNVSVTGATYLYPVSQGKGGIAATPSLAPSVPTSNDNSMDSHYVSLSPTPRMMPAAADASSPSLDISLLPPSTAPHSSSVDAMHNQHSTSKFTLNNAEALFASSLANTTSLSNAHIQIPVTSPSPSPSIDDAESTPLLRHRVVAASSSHSGHGSPTGSSPAADWSDQTFMPLQVRPPYPMSELSVVREELASVRSYNSHNISDMLNSTSRTAPLFTGPTSTQQQSLLQRVATSSKTGQRNWDQNVDVAEDEIDRLAHPRSEVDRLINPSLPSSNSNSDPTASSHPLALNRVDAAPHAIQSKGSGKQPTSDVVLDYNKDVLASAEGVASSSSSTAILVDQEEVDRLVNPSGKKSTDIAAVTSATSSSDNPPSVSGSPKNFVRQITGGMKMASIVQSVMHVTSPSLSHVVSPTNTITSSSHLSADSGSSTGGPRLGTILKRTMSKRMLQLAHQKVSIATSSGNELDDDVDAVVNPKGSASLAMPGKQKSVISKPSTQQDPSLTSEQFAAKLSQQQQSEVTSLRSDGIVTLDKKLSSCNGNSDGLSSVSSKHHRAGSVSSANTNNNNNNYLATKPTHTPQLSNSLSSRKLSSATPVAGAGHARRISVVHMSVEDLIDEELRLTIPGYETLKLENPGKAAKLRVKYMNDSNAVG